MDAMASFPVSQFHEGIESTPGPVPVTEGTDLLPLDVAERLVVFRSGGKSYRHIFNRLRPADWEKFFGHIVAEFKQEKGGFSQVVDADYASLVFYAKAIKRVEGYLTRDGSAPENLPTWPECVPQHHRLAAVDLLMRVSRGEAGDDSMLEAEGVTVTLDALWNESAPGEMKQYKGLVHKFSSPTAEQRRRSLRAKNRAFIAGGSRSGITMLPSSHLVLVKLYDDLILSVEGYGVAGRPLDSREQIAREMDSLHKAHAVGQLFPTSLKTDAPEEKGAEPEATE
jgi:hypothetical protein